MPLAQDSDALALMPGWWPEAMLWLVLGLLVVGAATAFGVWALARSMAASRQDERALEALQEIKRTLDRWLAERDDLDQRRIEHLLIDLRDGARRVEEVLLRAQEQRHGETEALVPATSPGLGERVVNRLLALGYERVEIVSSNEELGALAQADGEVLVEARRADVLNKGKVLIRAGRIDAVQLQPVFSLFP